MWTDPEISAIVFYCTRSNFMVYEKKKTTVVVVYVQSPMILFISGLKKSLRYLDLIFDFFERLILPSVLRKKISNI